MIDVSSPRLGLSERKITEAGFLVATVCCFLGVLMAAMVYNYLIEKMRYEYALREKAAAQGCVILTQ